MTLNDFANTLLRSAKAIDAPAEGAKERALDHLASKTVTIAAAGSPAVAVAAAPTKFGAFTWSVAAAAAIVAGAGGYGVGRRTADRPRIVAVTPSIEASAPAESHGGPRPASVPSPVAQSAPADTCKTHHIADTPPAACSQTGAVVPLNLTNTCAGDVDVYWVDYNCQEIFHARLANGEVFERGTQSGHVWRVRDHATRALLKEFSPQRVPGAPELVRDAPRRTLPDVVVRPNESAKEEPPLACSSAGRPTRFTLKNERDDQIVVMWVGLDCKEKFWDRVEAKRSIVVNGLDADAWRIRDAKTGEVVTDILPDVPDSRTFVTVP